jgi:EmrB/QacA subfamily drug resistance transporter
MNEGNRRWWALGVLCLGILMNAIDATIVNVALPSIKSDLGFSQSSLTWVVNAYLITFGSFLLLAGRLGDLLGRRRIFLAGLAIFTAASAACGIADDQTLLIGARFVQGIGGALTTSVIVAIIATEFPRPAEQAKAMSLYILVAVGGGSIGLLLGGVLTQLINWHWIFFINIPIGIATIFLGRLLIVESEAIGLADGIDWLGSILVTVALMVGVYAIVEATGYGWGSAHTIGFGALSIALLAAFFALESRISNPIMPPRILRLAGLRNSSLVRGFASAGMWTSFFFGALYLENVRGFGATDTGLAFLPVTLTVAACSAGITARLVGRFGPRQVLVPGLFATLAGLLVLATVDPSTAYFPVVFVALFLLGLGAGTSFVPLLTMAMADVPKADAGIGSGIINLSMQISAAVSLAILGTIATDHTKGLEAAGHSVDSALASGYSLAFLLAAGIVVIGIFVALFVLEAPAPAQEPDIREMAEASSETV